MGNFDKKIKMSAAKLLDFPYDIVMDYPKITITGDLVVTIENHRGVVEYLPERIRINSKMGQILIEGEKMIIKEIFSEKVQVEGLIKKFQLGS